MLTGNRRPRMPRSESENPLVTCGKDARSEGAHRFTDAAVATAPKGPPLAVLRGQGEHPAPGRRRPPVRAADRPYRALRPGPQDRPDPDGPAVPDRLLDRHRHRQRQPAEGGGARGLTRPATRRSRAECCTSRQAAPRQVSGAGAQPPSRAAGATKLTRRCSRPERRRSGLRPAGGTTSVQQHFDPRPRSRPSVGTTS